MMLTPLILRTKRVPANYSSFLEFHKGKVARCLQIFHTTGTWKPTPHIKPLPPKDRRMPGRPSVKRKKHPSENDDYPSRRNKKSIGREMTCQNYHEKGHNKKTCTKQKSDPPPKLVKPRGRPRINVHLPASVRPRGGEGGQGSGGGRCRGGRTSFVGVSFIDGEAMIHGIDGVVRPAWPSGVVPISNQGNEVGAHDGDQMRIHDERSNSRSYGGAVAVYSR
ncbi:LOW QUALITY PROTEIN: hypothetical protein OSB04_019653 [Centaurea solstitialis]|uniref:Uncharacterized protein n=1 Tax=Centaurea solstitialis TaxID=347529 RepID=A0AA38SQQ8_9ASTR|nr:LOW QUALITY PROTEIN: hypothetical protein OSB04_019653 [Centaurea solstitialis]